MTWHEVAPSLTLILLVLALIGLGYLVARSRGWTIQAQDVRIRLMAKRVDEAHQIATTAEQSATRAHESIDYSVRALTEEFAKISSRLDALLVIRETVREMEGRVEATQQEVEIVKAQLATLGCRYVACPLVAAAAPAEDESDG